MSEVKSHTALAPPEVPPSLAAEAKGLLLVTGMPHANDLEQHAPVDAHCLLTAEEHDYTTRAPYPDLANLRRNEDLRARALFQAIETIGKLIEETETIFAKAVRLSHPQWAIIWAIKELNEGGGVSVRDVAKRMMVDSSFVSTQTRLLEAIDVVHREQSSSDRRIVLLSLSHKITEEINELAPHLSALNDFIFADSHIEEVNTVLRVCKRLESRLAKAGSLLGLNDAISNRRSTPLNHRIPAKFIDTFDR